MRSESVLLVGGAGFIGQVFDIWDSQGQDAAVRT